MPEPLPIVALSPVSRVLRRSVCTTSTLLTVALLQLTNFGKDTCGEIQGSIEFAASCANTAMVQVCAEKYYPYVECLYEAAAIHASDGDLVCAELDCAAALGAATSDAVAARPAALVAATCAALVLYWAALPVMR